MIFIEHVNIHIFMEWRV